MSEASGLSIEYMGQNGEPLLVPRVSFAQQYVDVGSYYKSGSHRHVVQHALARRFDKEADCLLQSHAVCADACARENPAECIVQALQALCSTYAREEQSLYFLKKQIEVYSGDIQARTCSICLDEGCALSSLGMLPCAHVFHIECVRQSLAIAPTCPECRQEVPRVFRISPLSYEASPRPPPSAAPAPEKMPEHGSKLNLLAQKLRTILQADAQAKIIVFSQWETIEAKVALALRSYRIPHMRLQRRDPGETLRSFQEDPSSPHVLLLSLESAASGSNLQAANHVVFVHPMAASSIAEAVAQEKQAIGRVRRIGQTRGEIFVHRFITRNTIEESISMLHAHSIS